ncbi:MAG: hypothetical protein E6274_15605 [Clostridium sp.]|uniref:hypothetical protein n=1 Tax=Clostridium TaxID=1485 RepID=UPI000D20819B|nr:hypothetical protein [Clostridium sp.]AVP62353.1 hypothetical protein C7M79_17310 [Clostridium botulinum]MDU7253735.1 hypothetical protein [Clostridium sp.]
MNNNKFKLKRIINKYKKCMYILVLGCIILIFTFNMKDNILKIFLQTISSYFIVSCLLDVLKKYATDEELIKDIYEGVNSEIDAMQLGIKKIDINNEKLLTPEKIIKSAQKRIDILHVYGYRWTRDNETILTEALKNRVQIRVIISDFNNDITMKFYSNNMERDIQSKIQEVLNKWKEIYINSGQRNNLEIYLFDGAITHALHLNEQSVVIKSVPACKLYSKGNITTIYSKKLENGIYEKYEQEINQIVKESKLYPIEELLKKSEN